MSKVKEKYPDTSTSRGQRMAIWIIAIVMVGGTLVSFLIYVIATINPSVNSDQIIYEQALEKAQQEAEEEAAVKAQYQVFYDGVSASAFDGDSVTALTVETLREGDGAEVAATDTISANYSGWDSTGAIFDTTKRSADAETSPISFSLQQVITGWTEGLTGKKVGGVYLLTIPGDMAYGNTDTGYGYPVGALKFVVEIISIEEE